MLVVTISIQHCIHAPINCFERFLRLGRFGRDGYAQAAEPATSSVIHCSAVRVSLLTWCAKSICSLETATRLAVQNIRAAIACSLGGGAPRCKFRYISRSEPLVSRLGA